MTSEFLSEKCRWPWNFSRISIGILGGKAANIIFCESVSLNLLKTLQLHKGMFINDVSIFLLCFLRPHFGSSYFYPLANFESILTLPTPKMPSSLLICTLKSDFEGGSWYFLGFWNRPRFLKSEIRVQMKRLIVFYGRAVRDHPYIKGRSIWMSPKRHFWQRKMKCTLRTLDKGSPLRKKR